MREAIKVLSALGRVSAQKGRGLYVADDDRLPGSTRWGGFFLPTDLDHVYMLFEIRRPSCARSKPPRRPAGTAT